MTEIRNWLFGIMAVSVCGSILTALTEKTAGSTVVKAALSLAMILTIIYPLGERLDLQFSYSFSTPDTTVYLSQTQDISRTLAEQELASYLAAYAAQCGIDCDVSVDCTLASDGAIAPERVVIQCRSDPAKARDGLSDKIQHEFGLSEKNIEYIERD